MAQLNPEPRSVIHGAFMRFLIIVSSAIGSFLFVFTVSFAATIYHLRDVVSGREKANEPKKQNDTENYKLRQPYPDMKNLRITKDLSYYARALGLNLEEYSITTDDGHILTLHRVVDPNDLPQDRDRKKPILLQHGLLLCSGAWLSPGQNSLPFYFMEQGYDVWMGNNRSGFKARHTEHTGNLMHNEKVWDWDSRHLAYYDLPCIIDNVLAHKPYHTQLLLVGHSQGCTQTMILLRNENLKPWHRKIEHFFALAPAVFPGSMFHERRFIKFIHHRSPRMYAAIFGNCCFLAILGQARTLLGTTSLFSLLSYQIFKYLFGWNLKNNYRDKKVIHIQFLFNATFVSARLMAWWLSYAVEEGFSNQLQPKQAYKDGTTSTFTPVNSINENEDLEKNPRGELEEVEDSKTFFPYKEEWFTFNKKEELVPMLIFVGGQDFLVDGLRFATHMKHYERRYYKQSENLDVIEIPEYNHLDVIWALNCIGKIGMLIHEKAQARAEMEQTAQAAESKAE